MKQIQRTMISGLEGNSGLLLPIFIADQMVLQPLGQLAVH